MKSIESHVWAILCIIEDHEEPWKKIPDFKPQGFKNVLRQGTREELPEEDDRQKVMKLVDLQTLRDLPKWKWDDIFALAGHP